jgi:hypothetical protein
MYKYVYHSDNFNLSSHKSLICNLNWEDIYVLYIYIYVYVYIYLFIYLNELKNISFSLHSSNFQTITRPVINIHVAVTV